jgi:hypothetical protein
MSARLFLAAVPALVLALMPAAHADSTEAAPSQAGAVIPNDIPDLHEEAAAAGIDHTYTGDFQFFVGGGVAAFDCDGDRKPDLFMAGGTNPAELFRNESPTGGALKFEKVALDGIPASDLLKVVGAYPIDVDNDGIMDLMVLRVGSNLLLKGKGDCRFELENDAWAFDGGNDWSTAFSAEWEIGQTFPTLAVGNYIDRQSIGAPESKCSTSYIIRPGSGDKPNYSTPFPLNPSWCSLSMLFTDWNNSGTMSLRVTNDRQYYRGGEEQLWHVDPGKSPYAYTAADGWQHLSIYGMGIAQARLNGAGYPVYALTSMGDTKLQQLDPDARDTQDGDTMSPMYKDIAYASGATAQRPYVGTDYRGSTGWHSQFADFNNDGLLDLFIAKGNVDSMPDFAAADPDNLLLGQWDGSFKEAGARAGLSSTADRRGRGAAVIDLNMDGLLDLVVVNRRAPASLFRNLGAKTTWGTEAPMGNWIEVELFQEGANRNAVGAQITVKAGNNRMERTVQIGGGHASGQSGFYHIGLGVAERAEIRVKWPDGSWSNTYRVFANEFVRLDRAKPDAEYWYPEPASAAQ